MAQVTSGLRSVLSLPKIYQFLQNILSKDAGLSTLMSHIDAKEDDVVLDVGCGTGDIINFLPGNIKYLGLDLSQKYIEAAKKKHSDKGMFFQSSVADFDYSKIGKPDVVILIGVLHHLNDDEVKQVFSEIGKIKKENTRVVTIDCCYTDPQNFLAKKIISMDRGQNVRFQNEYEALMQPYVKKIESKIYTDLLRVPYTHLICECSY